MPDMSSIYQANFKKDDFLAGPRILTIKEAFQEEYENKQKGTKEKKVRIKFLEDDRGLVLSKTRYEDISAVAGSKDTDKWVGVKIECFLDPTIRDPAGKRGGIGCRKPSGS